jgi:hypothetical protein
MNQETFLMKQIPDEAEYVPDFVKNHCQHISVDDIVNFDRGESQVRIKGHVVGKVAALAVGIKTMGQKVPISVKPVGSGKYEIIDGNTRLLACQELEQETIWAEHWTARQNFSDARLKDHQDSMNDTGLCTPASTADINSSVRDKVKAGHLAELIGIDPEEDREAYIQEGAQHLATTTFPNSGLTMNHFEKQISKNLSKPRTNDKYVNYSKSTAVSFVADTNDKDWSPPHRKNSKQNIGAVDNGVCFYFAGSHSQFTTNILGNGSWRRTGENEEPVHVVAIRWDDSLSNIASDDTQERIHRYRLKAVNDFERHSKMKHEDSNCCACDELLFLPQIHDKENMHRMLTATQAKEAAKEFFKDKG